MTPTQPARISAFSLDRSIQLLGDKDALGRLFGPLEAGEPMVLGIYGASIAQEGGCLDQPRKRCMNFSGRRRSFEKGWAVRLLEHINRSWPHAGHRINNSALDAMGINAMGDCLLGHLPPRIHLMIFEFGSMAQINGAEAWHMEEALRLVLQMTPPPLVLMLSFHEWCTQKVQPRQLYSVGQKLGGFLSGYVYPDTPWARVEREVTRLCQHYGQACVSVKAGLDVQAYGDMPGFSVADLTGDDCLHPSDGRRGIELVSNLLTHWVDHARDVWGAKRPGRIFRAVSGHPQRITPAQKLRESSALPLRPPLWRENEAPRLPARCYTFRTALAGRMGLQRVQWCSAQAGAYAESARPKGRGRGKEQMKPHNETAGCILGEHRLHCPAAIGQDDELYRSFMADPPTGWFFCGVSLSPKKRKVSEGVVALTPGALLRAHVYAHDLGHGSSAGSDEDRAPRSWAHIRLTHLVSYEQMGVVELTCAEGCVCAAQQIDAHRTDDIRNVSIFVTHSLYAEMVGGEHTDRPCELRLQLLSHSSSGGHKFKVSALFVSRANEKARRVATLSLR